MSMAISRWSQPSDSYNYQYRSHPALPWKNGSWSLLTTSGEMASINHDIQKLGMGDQGGPWLMSKQTDVAVPVAYPKSDKFIGQFTVAGPKSSWTPPGLPTPCSESGLTSQGATMMARSMPNNPSADLAVGLAELAREGIPSAIGSQTWKNRSHIARSAGGEYLNVEFGWKPLVSEITDVANAVKDSERIWAAYRKGSSNKTRVGHHLEDSTLSASYTGEMIPLPSHVPTFLQGASVSYAKKHVWFKGCFVYYIPEPVDFASKMQYWASQADKILGLRLDPEVVWNLAPWSWATDWFANTGDVLHNVSRLGSDGLVMQYGYAMCEVSQETIHVGTHPNGGATSRRIVTKKTCRRVPANPYGFGVALSSLSARQLAILAALGLSKA